MMCQYLESRLQLRDGSIGQKTSIPLYLYPSLQGTGMDKPLLSDKNRYFLPHGPV